MDTTQPPNIIVSEEARECAQEILFKLNDGVANDEDVLAIKLVIQLLLTKSNHDQDGRIRELEKEIAVLRRSLQLKNDAAFNRSGL